MRNIMIVPNRFKKKKKKEDPKLSKTVLGGRILRSAEFNLKL